MQHASEEELILELSRTTRGRLLLERHAPSIPELASEAADALVEHGIARRDGDQLIIALDGPALSWELDVLANSYRSDVLNEPVYAAVQQHFDEEALDDASRDGYEAREWLRPVLVAIAPRDVTVETSDAVDPRISFGSWAFEDAIVSVPRYHVRGELERPIEERLFGWRLGINRDEHFAIDSAVTVTREDFFERVAAGALGGRVLVFVHGFATARDVAIMRAAQFAFDARFTGTTLAFIWPSQGKVGLASYRRDRAVLTAAGTALAQLLRELQRPGYEVSVFGHSLGCAFITNALSLLATATPPRLSELIFGAPDVGAAELQAAMPVVRQLAQRLTIYTSWRDIALYASAAVNKRIPIGLGRPRAFVVHGSDSIDASRVWHQFYRLDHAYVFGSSRLLADIHLALKGEPQTRFELRKAVGIRRWEFVPAKA